MDVEVRKYHIYLLFGLALVDTLFTLYGVSMGAHELNPFMQYMFESAGLVSGLLVKVVVSAVLIIGAWHVSKITYNVVGWVIIWIAIAMHFLVCFNNLMVVIAVS